MSASIYGDPTRKLDDPTIPLSKFADELPEAQRLLARTGAVSLHDHLVRMPANLDAALMERWRMTGEETMAVEEVSRSPYQAIVHSCLAFSGRKTVLEWASRTASRVRDAVGIHGIEQVDSDGPLVLLGLEDLGSTDGDLHGIDALYAAGVRTAGLAYNTGNAYGTGLLDTSGAGLTALGRLAVKRMNELGMIVDVAHTSEATAFDAIDVSTQPIVFSHAGSKAIWPSNRMKSDAVIAAVAQAGGLIGIEAAPGSTRAHRESGGHTVDDLVIHIEHCAEVAGVEHVALGGDTFYGDHLALYRATGSRPIAPDGAPAFDAEYVAGAENPSELPVQIAVRLLRRGWTPTDVSAVTGGNAARLIDAILHTNTQH